MSLDFVLLQVSLTKSDRSCQKKKKRGSNAKGDMSKSTRCYGYDLHFKMVVSKLKRQTAVKQ
jgi:hypothetical protein